MAIGGRQYMGRDAVLAALRASPHYRGVGMSWAPVRGGISAGAGLVRPASAEKFANHTGHVTANASAD